MREFLNRVEKSPLYQFLFFSVILALVYFPALSGGPIWDDIYRFFGQSNMFNDDQSIFFFFKEGFRWSVFNTYLLILFKFFGKNTLYYHLNSVFLFSLIGVLFYRILKKLNFKYPWQAVAVLLLIPVNVQNVAWIIQIKSLLAGLLLISSTSFYLLYNESEKKQNKYLVLSMFLYLTSLFCKSHFIHFPVLLIFYHFWKNDPLKLIVKRFFLFSLVMGGYLYFFLSGSFYEKRIKSVKKTFEERSSIYDKASERFVSEPEVEKEPEKPKVEIDPTEKFFKLEEAFLLEDQIFIDLDKLNDERRKKQLQSFVKFRDIFYFFYKKIDKFNLSDEEKLFYGEYLDYAFLDKRKHKGFYYRVLAIAQNTFHYVKKLILPIQLSGFYNHFEVENKFENTLKITFLVLIIFFYYLWFLQFLGGERSLPKILALLIGISFVPVIGFIKAPFMFITPVSDHHSFIAVFFFAPLLIMFMHKVFKSKKNFKIALTVLLCFYSAQSFNYSRSFKNTETFFKNILSYHPDHTLPYLVLGHWYILVGRSRESFDLMKKGIERYNQKNKEYLTVYGLPIETVQKSMTSNEYFSHIHLNPYYLMLHRQIRYFNRKFRDKYWKMP